MRQVVFFFLMVLATAPLIACGGGSSSSSSTTTYTVTVSPTTLSLNQSDVATVTATVLDSTGTVVTSAKAFAFTSDTPSVASVNPKTGAICAGTWDNSFIVCSPGQVGKATISATSGGVTGTATVYVHAKVDRVVVTTPSAACKSVGQTLQLTATAYSNGTDVTSTVGPFNWQLTVADVATIDENGLLTAHAPGSSSIYANISNVTSTPVTFTTCGVNNINLHVSGATDTAFTLATSATQQLQADVTDTAGATITPTLNWVSLNSDIATVDTTGKVTAVTPGTTTILAECATNCNYNLPFVYSNATVSTVSGTSATTVYVTGTSTTQLIPIDTTANTAGTAITLPSTPNSFLFFPGAKRAYLGSSGGLMTLDATSNTVTQNTAIPGKVLAVSPNANFVLVADTNAIYVQNASSGGSAAVIAITGATAAAFTPDSAYAYIAAGSTLYVYSTASNTVASIALASPINDVAEAPSGAFTFLAGGPAHAIQARTNCDNAAAAAFSTPGTPTNLAVSADAANVLALDSPGIDIVHRTSLAQPGCPTPLQASLSSVDFGQGAFNPTGFLLSTGGSKAYVTSNLAEVIAFDVNAKTTSTIALANGATGLAEGITADGAALYVGGSDNNVHLISPSSGSDTKQISVSFTPNLIAVRPQ